MVAVYKLAPPGLPERRRTGRAGRTVKTERNRRTRLWRYIAR